MKVTFVLGCGRSGTSILTRILSENGWNLPSESITSNCEDNNIVKLNERVMNYFNMNYFNIDKEITLDMIPYAVNLEIKSALRRLYGGIVNPVIKDPRMVFTYKCWTKHLYFSDFIGIFRNPIDVAESHFRLYPNRNYNDYLELWSNYNKQLIKLYKKHSFPVLDFDSNTFLEDIAAKLKIKISPSRYDSEKRTQAVSASVNKGINKIYSQLKEITIR